MIKYYKNNNKYFFYFAFFFVYVIWKKEHIQFMNFIKYVLYMKSMDVLNRIIGDR